MMSPLSLTIFTLLLAVSSLSAATHYVSLESANPTPPYTNWSTAARNIQDAVNVAATNDVVVVTNGVYPGGVTVANPLTLLSLNGSQFTAIDGGGAVQCVSLINGASLTGFTVTNGSAGFYNDGGGVSGGTLSNCVLTGNSTTYGDGGGASGCILYGCTLTGNVAWESGNGGGGASGSTLYNCTLSGNVAFESFLGGGGAFDSTLYNCTLSSNQAPENVLVYLGRGTGGGACLCTLYHCTLTDNSALAGGGAHSSALRNCALIRNVSIGSASAGGGADNCTLYNCTLSSNCASMSPGWSGYGVGGGACASTLYSCNLADNSGSGAGGGASESTLYNCLLTRNSATNGYGGGTFRSTNYNCTLTGNSAPAEYYGGGGADSCTLYNCTLTGNSAWKCGGARYCELKNSIVYFNTAAQGGSNYESSSTLNYCCTTPLPTNGVGNISNDPLFVETNRWSNLRLRPGSPCINAGNNSYATNTADLDGRPRVVSGIVDLGAYEFQPSIPGAFIGCLQQYGLPTDGSADFIDSDHDGMNNWQEWVCGTCPTNAQSVLRMLSATHTRTNTTVTWQSVAGVNYFLQRSANLGTPFALLATNIVGQTSTTSYADTNAGGVGPFFYRVGVQGP